jgi:hypothetical protein
MSAIRIATAAALLVLACQQKHAVVATSLRGGGQGNDHVAAAQTLTQRYARSRLAEWHVHASAAGSDCSVLFVETGVIMEDSMVEALHYGLGAYDVVDGGVRRFSREHKFRGVAYRDSTGRVWRYDVNEAMPLGGCR